MSAQPRFQLGQTVATPGALAALKAANQQAQEALNETTATIGSLQQHLSQLRRELKDLKEDKSSADIGQLNQDGLPVGFGFDDTCGSHNLRSSCKSPGRVLKTLRFKLLVSC